MTGRFLFRWRLAVIIAFFALASLLSWSVYAHKLDIAMPTLRDIVGENVAFLVCGPLSLVAFWLRAAGEARVGSAVYGQGASTRIVTGGPFRLMRHPLYAGAWLFFVATFAPYIQPLFLALFAIAFALCLRSIAIYEETELATTLGDAWTKYAAAVPRFLGVPHKVGDDDGIKPDARAYALATLGNLALLSFGAYRILVGADLKFRGLASLNLLCIALWIVAVVVRRAIRK